MRLEKFFHHLKWLKQNRDIYTFNVTFVGGAAAWGREQQEQNKTDERFQRDGIAFSH